MANERRLRANFIRGAIEDSPLLIGATVLTSAALASAPVVTSTGYLLIVLDPNGGGGAPEIAWITAHTAAATTATILRAQESTIARQHAAGVVWQHGPAATDFDVRAYAKRSYARANFR